jgi:hypothetical protein
MSKSAEGMEALNRLDTECASASDSTDDDKSAASPASDWWMALILEAKEVRSDSYRFMDA